MIVSSIRKLGFTGIATLLLVSGLAAPAVTAQAAGAESGAITLLQSPALGSLSSLGGISGYVASQSGGDTDRWLSSQGIDPTASGPITDTAIPAEAQGKILIDNNTVSLAADAAGVDVGYLVGDAMGTQTISASLSNLAVAPGHEYDAFTMDQNDYLTWLNGTTWQGNYSMPGIAAFSFTVTWSMTGAKVTPSVSTVINLAVASQIQNSINAGVAAPGSLKLSDVVSGGQQYSWDRTAAVPYSFAHSVGKALVPGGSVSVDLHDVVSESWLNDFTVDDAQVFGVLSQIPLTSLIPQDTIQSLSSLPELSGFSTARTTADMTALVMTDVLQGDGFTTWVSNTVISQVQSLLTSITGAGAGITMQSLNTAAQAKIRTNTPAVMALFVKDGFPTLIAQGVSATVEVNSRLDPGTVTSLTPTGVTYTASVGVDTGVSSLTLSDSMIVIDPGTCTGAPTANPETVTATATVVDTTGAPVVGAEVTFGVESPLALDNPVQITNENGVASATVTLPSPSPSEPDVTTRVTAHVDFGSGADLSPVSLTVQRQAGTANEGLPVLTVQPSIASPVSANGEDSYTASVTLTDQCGIPQAGKSVGFSVTGSAQLSATSVISDEKGYVSVTLTDEKAERVTVSAVDALGTPIAGPSVTVTFVYPPCTGDSCVALTPAGGTLTLNPAEVSSGGSTVAVASVVDSLGQPVPGVPVDFRIGGNAQFAEGPAAVAPPTDGAGETVMLITTGALDCGNLGFDVYATVTVSGQVIALTGSPARVSVVPLDGACEVPAAPPQVELANATLIAGNATPGATVQVADAAGMVLGSSPVDLTGYWSIPTPAGTPSQQITANALNSKGVAVASSTAWLDTDRPAGARIDRATAQQVAGDIGAVEPSATVTVVFPDQTTVDVLANADGSYSVATPDGMAEGTVTVIVTDQAGNRSYPVTANLVAYVPPTSKVTVTIKNAQVSAGGTQTVTGQGFRFLERVSAQLCSTTCIPIGNGYAGYNGQMSITFVVPNSTIPGGYTVKLIGPTSGAASSSRFQVIPSASSSAAALNTFLLLWAKWWWLFR